MARCWARDLAELLEIDEIGVNGNAQTVDDSNLLKIPAAGDTQRGGFSGDGLRARTRPAWPEQRASLRCLPPKNQLRVGGFRRFRSSIRDSGRESLPPFAEHENGPELRRAIVKAALMLIPDFSERIGVEDAVVM